MSMTTMGMIQLAFGLGPAVVVGLLKLILH